MAVVGPAWAEKPRDSEHASHPEHHKRSCEPRREGLRASGKLISAMLMASGKKEHFDGSITVDITRANHDAPLGSQTFTLKETHVRFAKGVTSTTTAAGDRVELDGRITVRRRDCTREGVTPEITVSKVTISEPKH
jgi:hypothetical protein